MSYRIGIDAINLKSSSRLAHTEYCSNQDLIDRVERETGKRFDSAWEFDFCWFSDDGPGDWFARGRATDMGHAVFLKGGTDRREPKPCPFRDAEEVLAFDAVAEYGLDDDAGLAAYYEKRHQETKKWAGDQVVPGGYYKTLWSGAIQAFGWDMLLEAASEKARFEKVLDSFFRLTLHHVRAWARTSIEVFNQHDDMVWTAGPFMSPDFYRAAVFPRYRELWKVLKDAGKKVVFTSDGDYTMFLGDVVAAGADGLIFEPLTSLERAVRDHGRTTALFGSAVDARTLTIGTREQILAEVETTVRLGKDCPGFLCAVGNHIPSNVPVENALFYFDSLKARWNR